MERERPAPVAAAEAEAGPPETDRLAVLLGHARGATGEARAASAARINALLKKMRAPGNEALEADVVLAGLEQKLFHDLVDDGGGDCRKEAVETLLATGFPHALKVSPEDLEYARNPTAKRRPRVLPEPDAEDARAPRAHVPGTIAILPHVVGVAAVAQATGALASISEGTPATVSGLASVLVGGGAWWLFKRGPGEERFGGFLLTALGVGAGVVAALDARNGLLAGGFAVVGAYGALLIQLHRHRWKTGD